MSGPVSWTEGFIAVDWGTTNRRAYLVENGESCTGEFEDGQGILSVPPGGFEAAVKEIRKRLGDKPLLLAGMIGSNRGWIEAPYVSCPAGLKDLAAALTWAEPGRTAIVPGLSFQDGHFDVMRGEEVQILGAAAAGDIPADSLVCHPGTHNKWIAVRGGCITSFRTVMTGELFSLLKDRSILAQLLQTPSHTGDAFSRGVERGLVGRGLSAELFEARASCLLGALNEQDAGSYVSGLLIGEDVRVGTGDYGAGPVVVMGRPELTQLYSAALGQAGVETKEIDGEHAFLAGARRIVESLQ